MKWVLLIIVLAVIGGGVVVTMPDVKRYLRMRRM